MFFYIILILIIFGLFSEVASNANKKSNQRKYSNNKKRTFNNGVVITENTILKEKLIKERGSTCERCSKNLELHVHKKSYTYQKEDNLNNIELICYECYKKVSNYQLESIKFNVNKLDPRNRAFVLTLHRDVPIKISYKTYHGQTSNRTVLPMKIYEENNEIYLKAHCYLRDEPRTFRISRIMRLHI